MVDGRLIASHTFYPRPVPHEQGVFMYGEAVNLNTTVTTDIIQTQKEGMCPLRQPWPTEKPGNAINKLPSLHKGDPFMPLEEPEDIQPPPYAPI